jgi:glycosyltransferase involved in cell wall biosynthesis
VTGAVPDTRTYLWNSAVAVAPLLTCRGVQNKVLEAVAAGLPAVVTPAVADGLPKEVLPACTICASPEAFAGAIVALQRRSAAERRAIAARADVRSLAWPRRTSQVLEIVEEARLAARHQRRALGHLKLVAQG